VVGEGPLAGRVLERGWVLAQAQAQERVHLSLRELKAIRVKDIQIYKVPLRKTNRDGRKQRSCEAGPDQIHARGFAS
jgi:hypothetical protein